MAIKLYHFTAEHLVPGIISKGLTLGSIPISIDPPCLMPGYQWLTVSKKWNQSWCEHSNLPYRRNAVRLTIKIPNHKKNNLFRWLKICDQFDSSEILNAFGDPQNWRVYRGNIDPLWIVRLNRNPIPWKR
jgi:hypothetical protein